MRIIKLKVPFLAKYMKFSTTSSYSQSVALTAVINLGLSGIGIISGLLVARLLGPTGRGEFAAIQTWPNMIAVLSAFGLHDALAYYVSREPNRVGSWLGTATISALLIGIPFATVGYWLMPWLLQAQSAVVIAAAQIYLLWYIPVNILLGFPSYPLRARNDLSTWNLLRLLPSLVWLSVLFYSTITQNVNPVSLSWHYLLASTTLVMPIWYIANRRLPHAIAVDRRQIRPLFVYGLPSVLSFIPANLNLRLDQMLIAGMLGPRILGLYVVAVAWSNALSPLLGALSATLLPRMASATSDLQSAQLFAQVTRIGLLISLAVSFFTALSAPFAIPLLFGSEYKDSIIVAMVLASGTGIALFNQLLVAGALSLGEPKLALLAEGIGLAVTVLLLLILLQPYQLMGAAIASICSYTTVSCVLLVLLKRKTKLSLAEFVCPQMVDIQTIIARLGTIAGLRSQPDSLPF